jgi:predicted ATPase
MPRPGDHSLVGRAAELAQLIKTLDEAAAGSGRSVFIAGEGGIG